MQDYRLEAMFDVWPGSFDIDKKTDAIAMVLPFDTKEAAEKYLHEISAVKKESWEKKGFRCRVVWSRVEKVK